MGARYTWISKTDKNKNKRYYRALQYMGETTLKRVSRDEYLRNRGGYAVAPTPKKTAKKTAKKTPSACSVKRVSVKRCPYGKLKK